MSNDHHQQQQQTVTTKLTKSRALYSQGGSATQRDTGAGEWNAYKGLSHACSQLPSWRSYLHKLHITEDVHRVVRGVEVVAAAVQLCVAPAKVTALSVRRLGAIQAAAARRGPVYCRW